MFSEFNSLNWPFQVKGNPPIKFRLRGSNVTVDYKLPNKEGPLVTVSPDLAKKTEISIPGCVNSLKLDVFREEYFEAYELHRDGEIFWICPKSMIHMWDQIQNILENVLVTKPYKLKVEEMYLVKDQKEGKMHRAVTIAVYDKVNEVFFIDKGVHAMVESEEIFSFNKPDLKIYPPLAVPVAVDATDELRSYPFYRKPFTSISPERLGIVRAMLVEISLIGAAFCGNLVIDKWALPVEVEPEQSNRKKEQGTMLKLKLY